MSAVQSRATLSESSLSQGAVGPVANVHGAKWASSSLGRLLRRVLFEPRILLLADQAIVSGTSFLTTVLIGRFTFPNELGVYSLAASQLITLLCIQESLITIPYTIQRHRPVGTAGEYAGGCLSLSAMLSVTAFFLLTITAFAASTFESQAELTAAAWGLAAVAPFAALRDFARQFAFAQLNVARALILDSGVAAMQLSLLCWLAWMGWMSAATALTAIGIACGVAGIAWLLSNNAPFLLRLDLIPRLARQNWTLGKWLFAHQLVTLVQAQAAYWLIAWTTGMVATGIFAACTSVALFANPLILGLSNTMCAKAALGLKEGGPSRLQRESIKDALLLGLTMILFCTVIFIWGEEIILLLFRSNEYGGHGHTITALALGQLAFAIGMPATNSLLAIERSRLNFWIAFYSSILMVLLIYPLAVHWGVLGAAYGVLIGTTARSATRWIAVVLIAREPSQVTRSASELAAVKQVLQQFTGRKNTEDANISALDPLDRVFLVRTQDPTRQPSDDNKLVVKLYPPELSSKAISSETQFEALAQRNSVLSSRHVDGWHLHTPVPLHVCESPTAVVMTAVPGKALAEWLEAPAGITENELIHVSRAIYTAIRAICLETQCHSSLTLEDVLCDFENKSISFVGSGVAAGQVQCVALSSDPLGIALAHIICDAARTHGLYIGRVGTRLNKQVIAEQILQHFFSTIGSAEERARALTQIQYFAHMYIAELNQPTLMRGPGDAITRVWQRLLRRIINNRLQSTFVRLKTQLSTIEVTAISPQFASTSLNRGRQ